MLVSSIVLTFEQPRADGKIVSFLTGRSASSYSWAENFWAAKGCSIVSTSHFRTLFHDGALLFGSHLCHRSAIPNHSFLGYPSRHKSANDGVAQSIPWGGSPDLTKARILIADDHTLVAEAFKKLLEPEFQVLGTVSDGRALLRAAAELKPDLALVDLNMPLLNGLDAGAQLKESMPRLKIIVLTMNEDTEIAAEALGKWASGYLLKKSAGSELLKAVREVLRGAKYVTPAVQIGLEESPLRDSRSEAARVLTPRQREVLQLLAEG